jgi:hypothetical protein
VTGHALTPPLPLWPQLSLFEPHHSELPLTHSQKSTASSQAKPSTKAKAAAPTSAATAKSSRSASRPTQSRRRDAARPLRATTTLYTRRLRQYLTHNACSGGSKGKLRYRAMGPRYNAITRVMHMPHGVQEVPHFYVCFVSLLLFGYRCRGLLLCFCMLCEGASHFLMLGLGGGNAIADCCMNGYNDSYV